MPEWTITISDGFCTYGYKIDGRGSASIESIKDAVVEHLEGTETSSKLLDTSGADKLVGAIFDDYARESSSIQRNSNL